MSGSYTNGLSINDVVDVTISLTPAGAQPRNFGATLIIGGSGIINTTQRLRSYASIIDVGVDFANTTPEYLAAVLFFGQSPQPSQLYIGAWAETATPGSLTGGVLSPAEQLLSNFTGITTGSMSVSFDGSAHALSAVSFAAATNLNQVASIIQSAFAAGGIYPLVTWNPSTSQFVITSNLTGDTSTVSYATPTGSGVDISSLLGLTQAAGATIVDGISAESALDAVEALAIASNDWYLFTFASVNLADADHEAIAAWTEAASPTRAYAITTQSPNATNPSDTTDLGSYLVQQGYTRTFGQYSSQNPYAIAAILGRLATVAWSTGANVALIIKFQNEVGVASELLTEAQAATLTAKGWNYFALYQNGTAIVQQGACFSGLWIDVRISCDWLQNQAQTDLFNALVQAGTKIPQTDAGVNILVTTLANTLTQAVNNGMVAPGLWNAPGFGSLQQGQTLTKGFYIYAAPVASQTEAQRITRVAPAIQAAVKLAGGIQSVNVAINVNQ